MQEILTRAFLNLHICFLSEIFLKPGQAPGLPLLPSNEQTELRGWQCSNPGSPSYSPPLCDGCGAVDLEATAI